VVAPLLQTKLYIPPTRPALVPRPRLVERLNQGLHRKLTLLSAPAGSGKTTLLAEWVAGCERPVGWLSLDEGDNDLARWLAYLFAALQRIRDRGEAIASVRDSALSAFQSPRPPPVESVLTGLINAIAAVPDPLALVLDDYHVIKAKPVHSAVAFLLDNLPPPMHVVIATRSDPPLPIARLRGRGQVTELRLSDLRFTPDEIAQFLQRVVGVDLDAEDLAALTMRTEGWVAGLQMAAIAMQSYLAEPSARAQPPRAAQGKENVAAFLRSFAGSDRFVLDYLVEEVLQHQPLEVQTFLLHTSILDRLTASLCDAVVGQRATEAGGQNAVEDDLASSVLRPWSSSQQMLERLEGANLFLVPLDGERRWYRYHRLFADLLCKRLHQTHPDLVPTLHRRASEWYDRTGQRTVAIEHALAAGDLEWTADLIEQAAEPTLMRSEVATFLRWVEALPDEAVLARPGLAAFHSWAMLLGGHPLEAAEARLQEALERDPDRQVAGHAAAFRALIAALQGKMHQSIELSAQALALLPPESLLLRGMVADNLGITHLFTGNIEAAIEALDEAIRIGQQVGNVMIAVGALCNVAGLCVLQGQLRRAEALYQRALDLATDEQGQWLPIAGKALLGLGEVARAWDDLGAAERYLIQGIERMRHYGEVGLVVGYTSLAFTRQAQGDPQGAQEAMANAQEAAVRFDATELDDRLVDACQVRLWVAQGEIELAQRWVDEQEPDWTATKPAPGEPGRSSAFLEMGEIERITLVHLRLAQGRAGEALAVLEPLVHAAQRHGRVKRVVELLALQAVAYQVQGDTERALAVLERTLRLAEPDGYVRVFVEAGEPMAHLLYEAASRGVAANYVGRLLAAFPPVPEAPAVGPAAAPPHQAELVEPLSPRELEVLRLLAQGLSNREIAERLVISLSTVKGHTSNIYGKLAVGSRTQAVARARALGILAAG
jgi:LuxR family maltose regulon positive regulatory protein